MMFFYIIYWGPFQSLPQNKKARNTAGFKIDQFIPRARSYALQN